MLPDPNDSPAVGLKKTILDPISLFIPCQFTLPVRAVSCWDTLMVRTAMPKTPIDEDCNPLASKDDVRANSTTTYSNRKVDSIPVSTSM
jgi:hypothetical protein